MTYEESNWAKLSPRFRDAHNRLRAARGQPPIPPPAVDLYVEPPKRTVVPVSVMPDAEALGMMRAASARFYVALGGLRGAGFTLKDGAGNPLYEGDMPPDALLAPDRPRTKRQQEEAIEALVTDDDRARMRDLGGYREEGFELRR
jgi:hypothetical protein